MILDIFNSDAFGVESLTDAINKVPYKASRIGEMGIFEEKGVTTTSIVIEEKEGVLSLLATAARGAPASVAAKGKRTVRHLAIPHIPLDSSVLADEVQGVRAFGSETEVQTVASIVNEKIAEMRQSFEVTHEYHRLGALKGVILDADGETVIHNLFTEFGVTPTAPVAGGLLEFDFTAGTPSIHQTCMAIKREIERRLGALPYNHVHCLCDSTFFDNLTSEAGVVTAYNLWNAGAALRDDMRSSFTYAGVVFEEYRGGVGSIDFIEAGIPIFFPVGVPGLFKTYYAPADYISTVNTIGKPFYAMQERMAFDKGIMINTQSNPLSICTRPGVLLTGRMV